jgi:hypothetical protein
MTETAYFFPFVSQQHACSGLVGLVAVAAGIVCHIAIRPERSDVWNLIMGLCMCRELPSIHLVWLRTLGVMTSQADSTTFVRLHQELLHDGIHAGIMGRVAGETLDPTIAERDRRAASFGQVVKKRGY